MLKVSFSTEINEHRISLEDTLSFFNVYSVMGDNQEDYFWILDPIPEKTNPECPIFKVYEYGIFFIFKKDGFAQFDELKNLIQTGNDNKRKIEKVGIEKLPADVGNILLDVLPQYIIKYLAK